jgi:carbonic anhydrase-like protein
MFESREPFVADRIRAAAVTCSDGRWGRQIDEFIERGLALPRYDRVAVPGGAGCLAGHLASWKEEAAIERQLALLVEVHGLARVVLIAHQDCAFYSVSLRIAGAELERQQRHDLDVAAHRVRQLHAGMKVESWFARRDGAKVTFERWDAAK